MDVGEANLNELYITKIDWWQYQWQQIQPTPY